MKTNCRTILYFIAVAALASCAPKQEEKDTVSPRVEAADNTTEVTVMTLEPKMFSHEIVTNGKIAASSYVDLRFANSSAPIEKINFKNGQRVRKGETIASLDLFKLEKMLATAVNSLERSRLDYAEALIGQGYDPEDTIKVPAEVKRLAKLRSGMNQAEIQLAEAKRNLEDAVLKAPFDGIVANLFQKPGNWPDGSQPLCRILSAGSMEVDFPVLENELPLLHAGDAVEVRPYSSDRIYQGRVSSINPFVDKDGMVKVNASVSSPDGLFDGMNVRVSVKRDVETALVVPKSAVVLRSGGRKVVFTLVDGKAYWNYVATSLENMGEYVITEGLEPGQQVIITGNANLAHESPVKVLVDD